jgi:hypothetical protein
MLSIEVFVLRPAVLMGSSALTTVTKPVLSSRMLVIKTLSVLTPRAPLRPFLIAGPLALAAPGEQGAKVSAIVTAGSDRLCEERMAPFVGEGVGVGVGVKVGVGEGVGLTEGVGVLLFVTGLLCVATAEAVGRGEREPVELCMACALAVELASLPRERVCVPEAACDTPAAAVGDTEALGESLLTEALGVALLPREGVGGAEALKVAV